LSETAHKSEKTPPVPHHDHEHEHDDHADDGATATGRARTQAQLDALERPPFLIGSERSGTTLLRLMLSHHPQLAWCNEFEYAVDQVRDDGAPPELDAYREYLSAHRVFQATGFQIESDADYRRIVRGFLDQKRRREGKPIVGATCHRHYGRLLKLWPEAKLIYLRRDPRDVARSCVQMGWDGNVYTGVVRWLRAEDEWAALKPTLPEGRWMELSYESLIRQPQRELTRICEFLGVAWSARMLDYPQTTSYGEPDPSLIAQWKRKLSKRELQWVESRTADRLEAFGYELSGHPRRSVGAGERAWLRVQDRLGRLRFRLRRYGVRLALTDSLSRRVGPWAWRKRVLLQKAAVDRRHLK